MWAFAVFSACLVLSYGFDCTVLNRQTWNERQNVSQQTWHTCGLTCACAYEKFKNSANGFENDDRIYKRLVSLAFPFWNTVYRFNLRSRVTGLLPGVSSIA